MEIHPCVDLVLFVADRPPAPKNYSCVGTAARPGRLGARDPEPVGYDIADLVFWSPLGAAGVEYHTDTC